VENPVENPSYPQLGENPVENPRGRAPKKKVEAGLRRVF
jgi:hypothetical protein